MIACHAGHIEIVKEILSCKHTKVNKKNKDGIAALHVACEKGNAEIVNMLNTKCQKY